MAGHRTKLKVPSAESDSDLRWFRREPSENIMKSDNRIKGEKDHGP